MVDSDKLKAIMKDRDVPEQWAADRLKLAQSSLNLKINNRRPFSIPEMYQLGDLLKLDATELRAIFFNQNVT